MFKSLEERSHMLVETWKMKPPIKYQEMKITISKMKNTLYGINSRLKIAKENLKTIRKQ